MPIDDSLVSSLMTQHRTTVVIAGVLLLGLLAFIGRRAGDSLAARRHLSPNELRRHRAIRRAQRDHTRELKALDERIKAAQEDLTQAQLVEHRRTLGPLHLDQLTLRAGRRVIDLNSGVSAVVITQEAPPRGRWATAAKAVVDVPQGRTGVVIADGTWRRTFWFDLAQEDAVRDLAQTINTCAADAAQCRERVQARILAAEQELHAVETDTPELDEIEELLDQLGEDPLPQARREVRQQRRSAMRTRGRALLHR